MPQKQPNPPPNPPKIGARTVWVCGKMRGKDDAGNPACASLNDFIGPVSLNQVLPQGATEWPNCRYPLAR